MTSWALGVVEYTMQPYHSTERRNDKQTNRVTGSSVCAIGHAYAIVQKYLRLVKNHLGRCKQNVHMSH